MPPSKTYEAEAARLARALDIAVAAFKNHLSDEGWSEAQLRHIIHVYEEWKMEALHPAPQYRRLAVIKQLTHDALTIFQEGTGGAVSYFWAQVAEEKLGYERTDRLRKLLDRGKLRTQREFDDVTDSLVAARQQGRITEQEASQLSAMLGDFEARRRT